MKKLTRIFSYFSPFFLYYTVIYFISQVIKFTLKIESVWQMCWDKMRFIVGADESPYLLIFLNLYTIVLYWMLGFMFIAMEKYKKPKVIENYKIQSRTSEIEQKNKLFHVSH